MWNVIGKTRDWCCCVSQYDQVMKIVEVLGMPPKHMIDASPKWEKYFERLHDGTYQPRRTREGKIVSC